MTGCASTEQLPAALKSFGMSPVSYGARKGDLVVMLDGKVIGFMSSHTIRATCDQLRAMKSQEHPAVPQMLEIALVMPSERGQFPGLFMFSAPARLIRPVRNLRTNLTEYISTFEQVCRPRLFLRI